MRGFENMKKCNTPITFIEHEEIQSVKTTIGESMIFERTTVVVVKGSIGR